MKKSEYIPFPPGTVRGPYRDHGSVQFLVQTPNGWVPFVRPEQDEKECEQAAASFGAKHVEIPS